MEVWKEVPNFEALYEVSTLGNVRRKYRDRTKKVTKGNSGYLYTSFCRGGIDSMQLVHRLVAITFIENPLNKPCVNHKDGNKLNNHVKNLEWVTQRENIEHSIKTGLTTFKKGELCHNTVLTDKEVKEIYSLATSGIFTLKKISPWAG